MTSNKNWTNPQIAHLLESVKVSYVIKEENRFKIAAYDNAADAVRNAGANVKDMWQNGKLEDIPGVGPSIASHLDELFRTGQVKHFKQVFKDLPAAMFELIKISGIGPKLAYKLCRQLKIGPKGNVFKKLEQAVLNGKIRNLSGFGAKSEAEILENLKAYNKRSKSKRILLVSAEQISQPLVDYLASFSSVKKVNVLGSLRRKVATVGDIDISVASEKAKQVVKWFVKYPKKTKIVESGEKKARILINEVQVDLMVEPPSSYGALLQHFTGSKQHNIHLREIALEKGLSLSEHGIRKIKEQRLKSKNKDKKTKLIKCRTEQELYQFLGMEWIPPEIREDHGEIEAALFRQPADQAILPGLPKLI